MTAYSNNPKPNIQIIEESCVDYKLVRNEVKITNENLERAKEFLNENLKEGDLYVGPIESIDVFYDDLKYNGNYKTYNVLADPYYELYERVNNEWILKDKHNCSC